jgi:hypothetical protein
MNVTINKVVVTTQVVEKINKVGVTTKVVEKINKVVVTTKVVEKINKVGVTTKAVKIQLVNFYCKKRRSLQLLLLLTFHRYKDSIFSSTKGIFHESPMLAWKE